MNENMKGAWIAVAITLPILFGFGWVADIITRAAMGAMVVSHGREVTPELMEPILPRMVWWLLAIWAVAGGAVLGMAKLGLGGPHHHRMPVPPPWKKDAE